MKRLISIEFQKIWLNKSSRLLVIAYFALLTFIAAFAAIRFNLFGNEIRLADQGIFNFPFIWHFNTYMAAILKIFLAVVVVSMMANEYSYGTLKQNLIDGLSKKEFVMSKFLTVLIFSAGSTVFILLLSLILGYSFSSYTELAIVLTDMDYLLAFFVKLVGFFSFCLFLGVLVKRSAFALGFLVLWSFIEFIIYGLLRWTFYDTSDIAHYVQRLLPLGAMSELILNPLRRLSAIKNIEQQTQIVNNLNYEVNYLQIVIVLIWTSLFLYGTYRILKKRDL